jgi:hypothetical protein
VKIPFYPIIPDPSQGFSPTGSGPKTAVTGVTGPDRFRYRSVTNRWDSNI